MKLEIANYNHVSEEPLSIHHSSYLILKGQLVFNQEENEQLCPSPTIKVCFKEERFAKSEKLINVRLEKEDDNIKCSFTLIAELKEGRNDLELEVSSLNNKSEVVNVPPVIYSRTEIGRIKSVIPILVFPSDKPFLETSELKKTFLKLTVSLKLVQSVFGELLACHNDGLSRRSFFIDEDAHETTVRLQLSTADLSQMDAYQVWEHVAKTVRKTERVWSDNRKYVAFLTSPWNNSGNNLKSALGGGGLAIFNVSISDPWPSAADNIFGALWNVQPLESEYPHLLPQLGQFGSIGRC